MSIHETADVEAAHNPKTVRKNVGERYRGCLRIDVRRSSDLYRKIEGWAAGAMLASA